MAPRVYAMAQKGDLNGEGTLISADVIDLRSNRLTNSGTIAGRKLTLLNTESLFNAGTITGDKVGINTTNNFDNIGGKVEAERALLVDVGGDLNHESTTMTTKVDLSHFQRSETTLGRKALFHVKGEDGQLQLSSNNLNAKGADIINDGNGSTLVQSKNNMNLTALSVGFDEKMGAGNHYRHEKVEQAISSQIKGKGDVTLTAKNLRAEGAQLESEAKLMAIAENDLVLNGATNTLELTEHHQYKSGVLTRKSKITDEYEKRIEQVGSELSGREIVLLTGHNVEATGVKLAADNNVLIDAKNDVLLQAGKNQLTHETQIVSKKSGLMGNGGIGFTMGSNKEKVNQDNTQESAAHSQIGSLAGNVTIQSGNRYQQVGSIVSSGKGDVDITSKIVDIDGIPLNYESNSRYEMQQKGLTIALTGAVASALQSVKSTAESTKMVGKSQNNRINAMSAMNVGFEGVRAAESTLALTETINKNGLGQGISSDVGVSITYGQQKSVQTQHSKGNTVEKSQVNAAGKVNITATDKGGQSQLTITGSDVSGRAGTHLKSDSNINILAADENHLERSKNKSTGFNIGVAIQFGNDVSAGITAGGNVAKGYGNGESQAWVTSQIGTQASKTIIESGKETNIKGSQVKGKRVEVRAENLTIESLQDTARYEGKQESVSGQVTVGYGFSASGNYNRSKVNSNYASVKTQAGIFSGDEGYDLNIRKHSELTGGLVTSTEKAEAEGKNRFETGTLMARDIENHSSVSGKGFGLGGGFSVSGGGAPKDLGSVKLQKVGKNHQDGSSKVEFSGIAGIANQGNWGIAKGLATGALGYLSRNSSENGVTSSSINTKNMIIRNEEAQRALGLSSEEIIARVNKENIHQSLNKPNVEQFKADLERDLAVSKAFVDNISRHGDEIYYNMEKNEDSIFSIKKKTDDCEHISCLKFDEKGNNTADNSQELKAALYSDKILTEEQAELFSRMATAGMLNLTPKDKVSSAILYDRDLASINETAVIANRGSAGLVNEFLFTGFERFRAWANVPAIFGASNATRDKVQILNKIEEYNTQAVKDGKRTYNIEALSHSLGVSGDKNMLNWSAHLGQKYPNTVIKFSHLGGSYPSEGISNQAKGLFKDVKTEYHGVEGDFVYSGIGGLFIGNNPNAKSIKGLSFGEAHSEANQNINNLKYVYSEKEREKMEKTKEIINKIYPIDGKRYFNKVE